MKKIMLATDFSERSDRALRRATLLARQFGASLSVVHVVDDDQPSRIVESERNAASGLLRELRNTLQSVDGTTCDTRVILEDAFVGTTMEGRLTAKTGTLGNPPVDLDPPAVKGLAGYLGATSGDTIEFVMILNSPDIDEPENYSAFWLALGERLGSYPDGPAPSTVGPR